MHTNKMREQFEAWISSYIGSTWLGRNDHQMDEYIDENAQFMWEAWQASREAVVVELPSEDTCRTSTSKEEAAQDAYNHALGECRSVIEAQGVKCK